MSIIFDALDKLEKAKKTDNSIVLDKPGVEHNKTLNTLKSFLLHKDRKYLVYTAVLIVSFFIVKSGLSLLYKSNSLTAQKTAYSLNKARLKDAKSLPDSPNVLNIAKILAFNPEKIVNNAKLVLNGIAFSSSCDENFALINNTVVKEGDKINGEVVSRISEDGVELQTKDSKIYKLYSCYDKKK